MCGRYLFSVEDTEGLREVIAEVQRRSDSEDTLNFKMAGDVYPTNKAAVLIASGNEVHARLFKWGYPVQGKNLINARSETAEERVLFKHSLEHGKRCVIPMSGFYEWDKTKHQHLFRLRGKQPMFLAGLYSEYDGEPCFVILTTEPNDSVKDVHHRMPLVLQDKKEMQAWLMDSAQTKPILHGAPPMLDCTRMDGQLSMY